MIDGATEWLRSTLLRFFKTALIRLSYSGNKKMVVSLPGVEPGLSE